MRIRRLEIDGFGLFHDVASPSLGPGLTVFWGPNEAGKTTLMSFVRHLLFGFPDRRSNRNRYEPLAGGRYGGSLLVEAGGREYRLVRQEGRLAAGEVRVIDSEGTDLGETMLDGLLAGAGRSLYENVFAFGLDELERLESLQDDALAGYIYSAALGTGRRSIVDIDQQLEREMEERYKPRGQRPVNQALKEYRELERRLRELKADSAEYGELLREIAILEAERDATVEELQSGRAVLEHWRKLVRAWPDWERLQNLRRELARLPEIASFPPNGVDRLEQVQGQLEVARRKLTGIRERIRQTSDELGNLQPDEEILACRPAILALSSELAAFRQASRDRPAEEETCESRRRQWREALTQLGEGWGEERIETFDTSLVVYGEVRTHQEELESAARAAEQARHRLDQVRREQAESRQERDQARERLASFTATGEDPAGVDGQARPASDEKEVALEELRAAFEERARQEQQAGFVSIRQQDLEQRLAVLTEAAAAGREKAPDRARTVAAVTAAVGLLGAAIGALLPLPGLAGMGLLLLLLGAAGWVFLTGWEKEQDRSRQAAEKSTATERERLVAELAGLRQAAAEATEAAERADRRAREAGRAAAGRERVHPDELPELRERLRQERARHEEWARQKRRLDDIEGRLARIEERASEHEGEAEACQRRLMEGQAAWQAWLRDKGLSPSLSPVTVSELLTLAKQARASLEQRRDAERRLRDVEGRIEDYRARLNEVLAGLGRPPVEVEAVEKTATELAERLATADRKQEESLRLTRRLEELAAEQRELEQAAGEEEEKLERLLAAGGAAEEEEFRGRAELYDRRQVLQGEAERLEDGLAVHAGDPQGRPALEAALAAGPREGIEEGLAAAEEAVQRTEVRLEELRDRLSKAQLRRQQLEAATHVAAARQAQEAARTRIEQGAEEWAVRALARKLLQITRERYERDRQPAVLQRASLLFQAMTGGRFQRVLSPLGEQRILVEREGQTPLDTAALSRGTREQLFLAMRLALVEEYRRRRGHLPVLMDDILVNFDPGRLRSAVSTLADFGREQQLFFFTCHDRTLELFRALAPKTAVVEVTGGTIQSR